MGRRFATFSNDARVGSFFLTSLRVAARVPDHVVPLRRLELALNITNLFEEKGASTLSVGSATNSWAVYPIPPRQWFVTLSAAY